MNCVQCHKEIEDGDTIVPVTADSVVCGLICKKRREDAQEQLSKMIPHGRNRNGVWIASYVEHKNLSQHHIAAYQLVKDETSRDEVIDKLKDNGYIEVYKGGKSQHFVNKNRVLIEVYIWHHRELTINILYTSFDDAQSLQTFWTSFREIANGDYD